jgi:hypothetical protein
VQIDRPVLNDDFGGALTLRNGYDFTSLAECRFTWKLLQVAQPASEAPGAEKQGDVGVLAQGDVRGPAAEPHDSAKLALNLPASWRKADLLSVTALDPDGRELWTWAWPITSRSESLASPTPKNGAAPTLRKTREEFVLEAGDVHAAFDARTGLLRRFGRGDEAHGPTNGPRLTYARPPGTGEVTWLPARETGDAGGSTTFQLQTAQRASTVEIDVEASSGTVFHQFKLEISAAGDAWKTVFDGARRRNDGLRYDLPPQRVAAIRISDVRGSDDKPVKLKSLRIGYEADRFPPEFSAAEKVTAGTVGGALPGAAAWVESTDAQGLDRVRWTLRADGSLELDLRYTLEGAFVFHGVTFDHARADLTAFRWLGEGPHRVWQNRLRGTWFGVHRHEPHDLQPGSSWDYPEFEGYFGGFRWVDLFTRGAGLRISSELPGLYFRVGTPRISHANTSPDFPEGDISFVQAIPPIGSKFKAPEQTAPASRWSQAKGPYDQRLIFRLQD